MIKRLYIGDGVYVSTTEVPGEFKLYTSDGIRETNIIYLEEHMLRSLIDFRDSVIPPRRDEHGDET